jgi:hypothetical protein
MYMFIFRFKNYKINWLPSRKNFIRRRRTMPHWLDISILEGRRRRPERRQRRKARRKAMVVAPTSDEGQSSKDVRTWRK